MLVFIDESGDSGFKLQKGSTTSFVVALVIFDENLDAEETALEIKKYRKKIGKTERFEFKFNKCNKELRIGFLKAVKKCNFRIRVIVFEKEKIYSLNLKRKTETFYKFVIRQVLQHNGKTIKNAKIKLDGLGERKFRKALSTYLRRYLNTNKERIMENLRFVDSNSNVLIQLADMVAGAIRISYDANRKDAGEYKKIIKSRIDDLSEFE